MQHDNKFEPSFKLYFTSITEWQLQKCDIVITCKQSTSKVEGIRLVKSGFQRFYL